MLFFDVFYLNTRSKVPLKPTSNKFKRSFLGKASSKRWSVVAALAATFSIGASGAACPFNPTQSAEPRGLSSAALFSRYAEGLTGAALTQKLTTATPQSVANYIDSHIDFLDIDGDGALTETDATLISRRLLGFAGNRLTSGLSINGARKSSGAISRYFDDDCPGSITLPIEVIGAAGTVMQRKFAIRSQISPSTVTRLVLTCHRCSWRDGAVASGQARGAKASVQVNNGAWIDVSEANAAMFPAEAAVGGLIGGFNTTRFSLPISGVVSGVNTVKFRFNANDGFTTGFRILRMDLQTSSGSSALFNSSPIEIDPGTWRPVAVGDNLNADIDAGRALWLGSVALKESPLSNRALLASCSSCHAIDGRDLKYFNYSDRSIIERSKFHGLNTTQGKQLAAYIRSRTSPAPSGARPWNPPYQPGAGTDAKPAVEWAAGAGLDAVLERDEDMVSSLFPGGTTTTEIRRVIKPDSTINIREIPISIQFPDWSDWLPEEHPLDVIGRELFETGTAAVTRPLQKQFEELEALFRSTPIATLIESGDLYKYLNRFADDSANLPNPTADAAQEAGLDELRFTQSLMKWGAVKQWEIMQRYALEDKAALVHGSTGEPRSWLTLRRNVFEIAPHRSAKLRDASGEIVLVPNFPYQSLMQGKYASTAWYQLQLTINSGNRRGINLWPVDWNYQPAHVDNLFQQAGGPPNPYRLVASHAKMYHQFADGDAMNATAMGLRQIHIHRIVPSSELGRTLDELPAPTRLRVYNAMLRTTMDILERYPPDVWERSLDTENNVVEPINYLLTKKNITRQQLNRECHTTQHANCWYSSIPYFKEIGVDAAVLTRMIDWGKAMWPQAANNWDALR
jgi:hypothetical protein